MKKTVIKNTAFTILVSSLLLCIVSCSTVDSSWLREEDGNEYNISSGRAGEHRFIVIRNSLRTWNGQLKGGKEKVDQRKAFLVSYAEKEANMICRKTGFTQVKDPYFDMSPYDDAAYHGGLLGILIAEGVALATSSRDNLPMAMYYYFRCRDDIVEEGKELEIRK